MQVRFFGQNLWRIRGGKGIRTPGLLIANETLYQLSYTPALPMKAEPRQVATISLCTPIYYTGGSERMRTLQSKIGVFEKVGECLYRYSSNGVYYGRIRVEGKEIKRSLETSDPAIARRELARFKDEQRQIDRSQGKLTLAELCDRYLKTIQHQKPKTVERKTYIVGRIKKDWPTGGLTQVAKIRPSDVYLCLARYQFGPASRNLHVETAKDLF